MKRWISAFLLIALGLSLLAGCGSTNKPTDPPAEEMGQQELQQAAQEGLQLLEEAVGKELTELTAQTAQEFQDSTVVQYVQSYQGAQVYGASMVAVTGAQNYTGGRYYDLQALLGDVSEQIAEAKQVPDWMEDTRNGEVSITYQKDTLQPVIYVAGGMPQVARKFDVLLSDGQGQITVTLITDLAGEALYDYATNMMGFDSATYDGVDVVKDGSVYYAYSPKDHIYIYFKSTYQTNIMDTLGSPRGARVALDLIHPLQMNGYVDDAQALAALKAFAKVGAWYENKFGYVGINGNGGDAVVVIGLDKDQLGSVAANGGEYGHYFFTTPEVVDGQDVLIHEYAHAVVKNIVRLNNSGQSGSLHEAIADTFACIYEADDTWKIGDTIEDNAVRDIRNFTGTMDDFRYDYEYDFSGDHYSKSITGKLELWINEKFTADTTSCNKGRYYNSKIVSHVMYEIWKNVLGEDFDQLGQILYDSLYYLPSWADFSDFRAAFIKAAQKYESNDVCAQIGAAFDAAGIYNRQVESTPYNALRLFDVPYRRIKTLHWDECAETNSLDQPGYWYCICRKNDIWVNLTYSGSQMGSLDAVPEKVCIGGQKDIPIAPSMKIGMTADQIANTYEIDMPQSQTVTKLRIDEFFLELRFDGDGENAILESVLISKGQEDSLLAMMGMPYSATKLALPNGIIDMSESRWYYQVSKGNCDIYFIYDGYQEAGAKPAYISVSDLSAEPCPIQIADQLTLGMTYGQIQKNYSGITELYNTEYGGTEIPVVAYLSVGGYTIEMCFEGLDENAILYSALIE